MENNKGLHTIIFFYAFIFTAFIAFLFTSMLDICGFSRIEVSQFLITRRVGNLRLGPVSGQEIGYKELENMGYELECLNFSTAESPWYVPHKHREWRVREDRMYTVSKNGQIIGWWWDGIFYDRQGMEEEYRYFIERHAELDILLVKGQMLSLEEDIKRHRYHILALMTVAALDNSRVDAETTKKKVSDDIIAAVRRLIDKEQVKVIVEPFGWMWEIHEVSDGGLLSVYVKKSYAELAVYPAISSFFIKKYGILLPINSYIAATYIPTYHDKDSYAGFDHFIYGQSRISVEKYLEPLIKRQVNYLLSGIAERAKLYYDEDFEERGRLYNEGKYNLLELYTLCLTLLEERNWEEEFPDLFKDIKKISEESSSKFYNLVRMESIGIPVPSFQYYTTPYLLFANIRELERSTGKVFYDAYSGVELYGHWPEGVAPLLLSVRSSPAVSMPGILSTVINVGMNFYVIRRLEELYGEDFAYRAYAGFLKSFGIVVFGLDEQKFKDIEDSCNLTNAGYKELATRYAEMIKSSGYEIPKALYDQLDMAVNAVLRSWNSDAARKYRLENNISEYPGMAVIIQEMKFGNLNEKSGSFVLFTREPMTGEKKLVIEYAPQVQGDALVGGRINPVPIEESGLEPKIIEEIKDYAQKIEQEFGDMQDIEGVVEDGKVWILQTRSAKRSPEAAVRVAVEMVNEGLITKEKLFTRIDMKQLKEDLSHFQIDPQVKVNPIGKGEGVYSGATWGAIALTLDKLKELEHAGIPAIWIKEEGYPQDYEGMILAEGLVVCKGNSVLSHAVNLGRNAKKPTIVGAAGLIIDKESRTVVIGGKTYKEGDLITIDGTTGNIYEGQLSLIKPQEVSNNYFQILIQWYKEIYGEEI